MKHCIVLFFLPKILIAYVAFSKKTVSPAQFFFLAMSMFPEVQKKAQAEIDAVVGHERLPNFSDYESLPYIGALIKELLRWQPAVPVGQSLVLCFLPMMTYTYNSLSLGVPHFSMKDDEYNGYFFPKHTLIIGNAWYVS